MTFPPFIRPRTLCLFPFSVSVTLPALITDIPPVQSVPSFGTLVSLKAQVCNLPAISSTLIFSSLSRIVQVGAPPFPRLPSNPLLVH